MMLHHEKYLTNRFKLGLAIDPLPALPIEVEEEL
jgi:hypothetical protein